MRRVLVLQALLLIASALSDDLPRIVLAPHNQVVVSGGVASFVCTATGNPKPQMEWRKNGKRVTTQRYTVLDMPSGSVLRIEPVRVGRDDAEFECVAENGIGEPVRALAFLKVIEEDDVPEGFPQFTVQPTIQGIEKGHSTVLNCKVEGSPQPSVIWLKDTIPVDMTNDRFDLVHGASLQITDTEEEDQGNYECVAENDKGTAISTLATLFVRVRRVAPYFSIPPENLYEVTPGSNLSMTCVAAGSPLPHVTWRKGSIDMTPEDNLPVGKNTLFLQNVRGSANYTCVASSKLGSVDATAQVLVQAMPRPPTNVQISDVTATSVRLSWSYDTGSENILYYIIQYKPKYANQEYGEISGINTLFYTIRNLLPYTEYEFYVIANNAIGRGSPSTPAIVVTGETDVPVQLNARDVTTHSMLLTWKPPPKFEPVKYNISYGAHKEFLDYQGVLQVLTIPNQCILVDRDIMQYTIIDLMPFTSYQVNITAVPQDGSIRPAAKIMVTTAMAAPNPMVKPDATDVGDDHIRVILPQASEEFGPISHYFLVVVPENLTTKDPNAFPIDELVSSPDDTSDAYIAAKFTLQSVPTTFNLGDGNKYNNYLNRRLQSGLRYKIFVRAVVDTPQKSLYTSSPFSSSLSLDASARKPSMSEVRPQDRHDNPDVAQIDGNQPNVLWIIGPVAVGLHTFQFNVPVLLRASIGLV